MIVEAISLGLVAVWGIMDTRWLGISMTDRPLVLCTLCGWVLGDLRTGILIGASLELFFLGTVNIGAATPPDVISGSVIACSFAILSGKGVEAAIVLALPIAVLAQQIGVLVRILNSSFSARAEKYAAEGNMWKVSFIHLVPTTILYALSEFLPVFLAIAFGAEAVTYILGLIPDIVMRGLTVASNLIPAFGFALLISMMVNKKLAPYLLLGFLLAAYAHLNIISVALFGVVLAFIVNQLMGRQNEEEV